jgi:CheY-like chemotaxis protein
MPIYGDLETIYLATILQLLCMEKKTGIFRVISAGNEVNVYLDDGNIVYASESQKEDRMGYLLKSQRTITTAQLNECLVLSKSRKKNLGDVLVERGYITPEKLQELNQQLVEDILYNMFLWKKGRFEYSDGLPDLLEKTFVQLGTMELILEASRRVDELSNITDEIPKNNLVYKISDEVQDKDEIKLNAKEWRVLSLIDGSRTVQELVNQSGYDEFAVYKILHKISSSKLIEEVKDSQAEAKTAPDKGAVTITDTGSKKTVLVVDDKSQVRSILRFSLKDSGYNTILASNGKEGLKFALTENPPDLIIIDIVLPDMPGLEVISQLRDSDLSKHVPIIILTGNARKQDILKGIELGASDYMLKPFKFVDLHVKIKKLLYH